MTLDEYTSLQGTSNPSILQTTKRDPKVQIYNTKIANPHHLTRAYLRFAGNGDTKGVAGE